MCLSPFPVLLFVSSPFSLFRQKASSERFEPWPRDKMISSFDSRIVCEELVPTCNSSPLSLSLPLFLCLSLFWHSETACLLHSEHDAGTGKQISVSKLLIVCTHFLCSSGRGGGGVELLFGKEAGKRRRRTRRRRESLDAGDMNEFHSCH